MKIIDLRPWHTKLAHLLWQGSGNPAQGEKLHPRNAGHGLGSLISGITRGRLTNRPPVPNSPFIVSVGNLALGGTGKTPVVSALSQDLARSGLSGAILTRGYRSPLNGPVIVTPDLVDAGDEARLLARETQAAGWIVVQARNRLEGLHWLQNQDIALDIIIAEDAHQTPNLPRHLDVLIIDSWYVDRSNNRKIVSAVSGSVFPFGPYREDSTGAERAGIWLLEDDGDEQFESQMGTHIKVASFKREVVLRTSKDGGGSYGVLSGIAKPWRFEQSMATLMDCEPALAIRCNDHDSYGPELIRRIVSAAKDANIGRILTTAKDWVKLQEIWPGELPVEVAELEISWGKGKTLPELVRERFSESKNKA